MQLVHLIVDGAAPRAVTLVIRAPRGVVQLRAFDRGRGYELDLSASEAVGGNGPDDERELVLEAWTSFAVGFLSSRATAAA